MKDKAICTIVTKNFIPWALAMYESLCEWDKEIVLEVLVLDEELEKETSSLPDNVRLHKISSIKTPKARLAIDRFGIDSSEIRWTLKPLFLLHLYDNFSYEKILFCDGDMHFYNDYNFIWKELDQNRFLLTPHWVSIAPTDEIFVLHNGGIYNAGFIGTTRDAKKILEWWADVCIFKCVSNPKYFNFDQGYLDIIPIYFTGVKTMTHKGCNVGYWNANYLKRCMIDGVGHVCDEREKFPIIFYHFGRGKFHHFIDGSDECLKPLLLRLNDRLQKYGYDENLISKAEQQIIKQRNGKTVKEKLFSFIKSRLPYDIYKK